jgi:hypothetical protein
MGSLIEELKRQEEAARAEADRLRARIEELARDLGKAEEQASRLVIAREEVTRVLGEPVGPAGAPAGATAGVAHRGGDGPPVAGLSTDKAKVEGLRSKLKLLASRGWLAPVARGLFTLPGHAGKTLKTGR